MIRAVRFTPRIRGGYDMGEVDEFLEVLEEQARRGGDLAALVERAAFAKVKWREAYDVADVDKFLARMAGVHTTPTEPPGTTPSGHGTRSDSAWAIRVLVGRVRFNPVRLHEGYDMAEVDQFLDTVVEAAEHDEPIGPLIDRARFTHVRVREGYDISEVDAFLQQLKGAPVAPDHPDLVQEHPGLIERLRRKL